VNRRRLAAYGLIVVYALLAVVWLGLAVYDASHRPSHVKLDLVLGISAILFIVIGVVNARRPVS
jgi:hypothetical protein